MIITIIIFLILSALFSGSEIAFISANKLRVELKKKKGARRGGVLARFYDQPATFLGTMLVGNNIALVVFASLMGDLLSSYYGSYIPNPLQLLFVNTIVITIIVLIFGEFIPKTLFRVFADDVLYFFAYPLQFLKIILAVPTWLMNLTSNWLLKIFFKVAPEDDETVFTRLDLENFVKDSQTDSETDIDKELFGKALNLQDTRVRDAMVPRTEIESVDINASIEELEGVFKESKLSRIIVIEGDIDHVLGYVHHQQLLDMPSSVKDVVLEIPFVPEAMKVTDLMNKLIKESLSIACVVDEFGSISGIITLEDILEEIFGEIEDEHDNDEEYVEQVISESEFLFSGRLEIDYLNEKYEAINLPEDEYHTLSGYLVMTTEKIPEQNAIIELNGYKFILELVSETKIELVRVIKMKEEEED